MSNSQFFFKIIIPNFNNEEYIRKCLDSIFQQTCKDFFVVLVDDCSTDQSYEIAKSYQTLYPNQMATLQVPKKCYAGGARNSGLDYPVEGIYTWFIDNDDWLYDESALETIKNTAISNNFPDLIRCPVLWYRGKNNKKNRAENLENESITSIIHRDCAVWRNCFLSSKTNKFIEDCLYTEDIIWFLKLIDNIDHTKIVAIKKLCYVYNLTNCNSSSNTKDLKRAQKRIFSIKETITNLNKMQFSKLEVKNGRNLYINSLKKRLQFYENQIDDIKYISIKQFQENLKI